MSAPLHPYPVIFKGDEPTLEMIKDESSPVAAPGLPTTIPPKSTSGGDNERKAALLTSFPWRVIGSEFEYCATPLVVVMTRKLVLTPGLTEPNEPPGVSLIAASVKFQVTGKEKVSPTFKAPWGRDALLAWYVLSPVLKPLILVMGIKA